MIDCCKNTFILKALTRVCTNHFSNVDSYPAVTYLQFLIQVYFSVTVGHMIIDLDLWPSIVTLTFELGLNSAMCQMLGVIYHLYVSRVDS